MSAFKMVGFIGLGVMGEPICRNIVKKSGARVTAFDLSPEPLQRLRGEGAEVAASVPGVIGAGEIVFLCLPSARHVRTVFEGDGIANAIRPGQIWSILEPRRSARPAISQISYRPGARRGSMRRSRAPARLRRTARSASWSAGRANSMTGSNP